MSAPPAFVLSTEQQEFRKTLRAFVDQHCASGQLRALFDDPAGFDPKAWKLMSEQLGLPGLAIPEKYNGTGAGITELAIASEELGRALYGSPFYATTVLATTLLLAIVDPQLGGDDGDDVVASLLSELAAGTRTATVALHDGLLPEAGRLSSVTARKDGDRWLLTGGRLTAIDGATADVTLVMAATDVGPSVFVVSDSPGGMLRSPLATLDLTRPQAALRFGDVPGHLVGRPGCAGHALRRLRSVAALLSAAEQLGGAQGCLDQAVQYAGSRIQFGRVIGSFQAVKHRLAELLTEVELARSAVYQAAWAADYSPAELDVAAAIAALWTTDVYQHMAEENIQIHGGIGFTWEHDAHLHLRRAQSAAAMLTPAEDHRAVVAADLVP